MTDQTPTVSGAARPETEERITLLEYASRSLFKAPGESDGEVRELGDKSNRQGMLHTLLRKENLTETGGESKQAVNTGTQGHPFNMQAVKEFLTSNEHHSTCISTKVAATVGLGFQTERDRKKIDIRDGIDPNELASLLNQSKDWEPTVPDTTFDPLCEYSFQDVLSHAAEDFHQLYSGAIEVVRRGDGEQITGLHYMPFENVHYFVEDDFYNYHYEITSPNGVNRRFARFGDKAGFLKRMQDQSDNRAQFALEGTQDKDTVSELIVFRKPSSLHRWYPIPKWLSCTATIELVQMLTQYKFDFFLNRCAPEFMLFIMGAKLIQADWDKVVTALKGNIGNGNSHKSFALNLVDKEMTVQLEKLMADGKEDVWSQDNDTCALKIVTAHQVPPLLAGIQIPGKLGATNELPNALMAFQALVIGQDQRIFERTLINTLGNKKLNGGLDIQPKDFLFRTILDEIDIDKADTISRMRQTLPEANAQGRDLKSGVKK